MRLLRATSSVKACKPTSWCTVTIFSKWGRRDWRKHALGKKETAQRIASAKAVSSAVLLPAGRGPQGTLVDGHRTGPQMTRTKISGETIATPQLAISLPSILRFELPSYLGLGGLSGSERRPFALITLFVSFSSTHPQCAQCKFKLTVVGWTSYISEHKKKSVKLRAREAVTMPALFFQSETACQQVLAAHSGKPCALPLQATVTPK